MRAAQRVGEVVHCLLENAFHAARPGGATSQTSKSQPGEGETVRMELKDNGIGVRPEDRERIFEPFVTTKTGGTGPRGTGLGLSIARTFAESMGDESALESSNGETVRVGPRRERWK
ncbi:MAG: ATP-binding protein [Polyangiaceae bacterium]